MNGPAVKVSNPSHTSAPCARRPKAPACAVPKLHPRQAREAEPKATRRERRERKADPAPKSKGPQPNFSANPLPTRNLQGLSFPVSQGRWEISHRPGARPSERRLPVAKLAMTRVGRSTRGSSGPQMFRLGTCNSSPANRIRTLFDPQVGRPNHHGVWSPENGASGGVRTRGTRGRLGGTTCLRLLV